MASLVTVGVVDAARSQDHSVMEKGARAGGEALGERGSQTDTVKFNVRGRVFEVLREPTLSLHPGTLMSTLAEEHSGDDPVFVEANPELFPYILEYMRSRSIHIPLTISRGAVLAEASRLGLTSITDGDIKQDMPALSAFLGEVITRRQGVDSILKDARIQLLGSSILSLLLKKTAIEKVSLPIPCTMAEICEASGLKCDPGAVQLLRGGDDLCNWLRTHGVEATFELGLVSPGVYVQHIVVREFRRDC